MTGRRDLGEQVHIMTHYGTWVGYGGDARTWLAIACLAIAWLAIALLAAACGTTFAGIRLPLAVRAEPASPPLVLHSLALAQVADDPQRTGSVAGGAFLIWSGDVAGSRPRLSVVPLSSC
jgi:hypothetical protein